MARAKLSSMSSKLFWNLPNLEKATKKVMTEIETKESCIIWTNDMKILVIKRKIKGKQTLNEQRLKDEL